MQVSVTRVIRRGLVSAVIPAVAGLLVAGVGSAQAATHTSGAVRSALHTAGGPVRLALAKGLFSDSFAEAPNGDVYFAVGKSVSVVDGTSAPKTVLKSVGKPILALAVNSSDLFVQTGLTVTEYSRSHAQFIRFWTLSSPEVPITSAGLYAVGNVVWSWTDWATDSSGFEFATISELSTSSPTSATKVVSRSNAYPGDMAADKTGAYFEVVKASQANGYVIKALPSGGTRRVADVNLDAPLTLSGGRVDLLSLHSNGDTYIDSYREGTLAGGKSKRVSASARGIAGTSAGLLVVQEPCASAICAKATVGVLSPLTGGVSQVVKVPGATSLLIGPAPAVIKESGRWLYLVRLAG
jgi:hypothetical protein